MGGLEVAILALTAALGVSTYFTYLVKGRLDFTTQLLYKQLEANRQMTNQHSLFIQGMVDQMRTIEEENNV